MTEALAALEGLSLLDESLPSGYVAGVLAEQNAEKVLLLFDLLFQRRNLGTRRKNQLFGLANVQQRSRTPVCQNLRQAK
jgi:hypothetical protein